MAVRARGHACDTASEPQFVRALPVGLAPGGLSCSHAAGRLPQRTTAAARLQACDYKGPHLADADTYWVATAQKG